MELESTNNDGILEYFLTYCQFPQFCDHGLVLRAESELVLHGLSKCWREMLCWAMRFNRNAVFLHLRDNTIPTYKFYDWLFIYDQNKPSPFYCGELQMSINSEEQVTGIDIIKPYLVNSSEFEVLEFVKEKIGEGLIVIITSQLDDRCRFTSKSLTPERAFWTPSQFHNYDYTRSWDVDRVGHPSQEYYAMRELLNRDGFIPGYQYRLRRPGDNALVEYATDYYHVADGWCGEPVRIGVSRPQDYRIIQLAEQN